VGVLISPRLGGAIVGVVAKVLAAFGFSAEESVHQVRIMRAMVYGFVSLEIDGGFGLPQSMDETFDRMIA
jgi:hypothetical protein